MVSNGNVTGLVERLVVQGLLDRKPSPTDRRVQIVSLTTKGRRTFRAMARANADWIAELIAGLTPQDTESLMRLLGKTKSSARRVIDRRDG